MNFWIALLVALAVWEWALIVDLHDDLAAHVTEHPAHCDSPEAER